MAAWNAFATAAPELAKLTRERFDSTELVMMGTQRRNGWPRISPIEYAFWDGDLVLHGMWRSKKFLDVMRDDRVTLHSTTVDKNGQEGDAKLYVRLSPMASKRIEPFWLHVHAATGWRPSGPAHVYVADIVSAGYVRFDGDGTMHMLTWPGKGWQRRKSG